MTTNSNILLATNKATLTMANKVKETAKMTIENNIHRIKTLSSYTRRNNRAAILVAGLIIGGMIAAASIFPGNSSSDTPARPAVAMADVTRLYTDVTSVDFLPEPSPSRATVRDTGLYTNMDFLPEPSSSRATARDTGLYTNMDFLPEPSSSRATARDTGLYTNMDFLAEPIPAVASRGNIGLYPDFDGFDYDPHEGLAAKLAGSSLVPTNAHSAMDSPQVDDWVALTYSE